jgi:hypothetical protein
MAGFLASAGAAEYEWSSVTTRARKNGSSMNPSTKLTFPEILAALPERSESEIISAVGRHMRASGRSGRQKKLTRCLACGKWLGARERRAHGKTCAGPDLA